MTYQEEKKKKLIIFGSGKVATRFLVNERLNIDGVFDNNKVGDRFWNITITRPMYNSQYYIIIATQNTFSSCETGSKYSQTQLISSAVSTREYSMSET